MLKKISIIAACMMLVAVIVYSCKKEKIVIPDEPIKTIDGSWKIISALRNGTDLTNRFDFSKFRIVFSDSSYTITEPVPFIVSKNGNWSFDDANYPFRVYFRATGDTTTGSTLQYPVVKGVRNMIISFSPGCTSNIYQYTLEKE